MALHVILATLASLTAVVGAGPIEFIQLSEDGSQFVSSVSKQPFYSWGFNYDHDRRGRLLEDYWKEEWSMVESDFQEMKKLGANIVRIHLQFGRFMESPEQPRQESLELLSDLVKLAEETQLYLDITGLGCYHKPDVPDWYDALAESQRWQAQATFWEAIAETCASSPAVFCYDLMNEPVVPGGNSARDDWLGPPFGDKHFVQFIALSRDGRMRPDIAREWIRTLCTAIRKHDQRHLVTVGLVPWSLDRPGLTSGFDPQRIADELDFLAVHIYPEKESQDEAIETLRAFAAVKKPVIIEEIFPLKCSPEELKSFIIESREYAAGWIGFYWGQSQDELRPPRTIAEAMTLGWLDLFQSLSPQILDEQSNDGG